MNICTSKYFTFGDLFNFLFQVASLGLIKSFYPLAASKCSIEKYSDELYSNKPNRLTRERCLLTKLSCKIQILCH